MTSSLVAAAEEGAETVRELPIPPEAFGIVTLAVFAALFAFTWAFRNVGKHH
jgi:hypothetical protein